jgi:hypothetical protein
MFFFNCTFLPFIVSMNGTFLFDILTLLVIYYIYLIYLNGNNGNSKPKVTPHALVGVTSYAGAIYQLSLVIRAKGEILAPLYPVTQPISNSVSNNESNV